MHKKLTKPQASYYQQLFDSAVIDNNCKPFIEFANIYEDYFKIHDHEKNLKNACEANSPEVLITLLQFELRDYLIADCFKTLSFTEHISCVDAIIKLIKPEGKKFVQLYIDDLLFASIEKDNVVMAKWCLDNNAKLIDRSFDYQPLDYAAQYNRKEIFDLLLAKGANLHHAQDNALFKAYKHAHFDLFFHILSIDPVIDVRLTDAIFNDLYFDYDHKGQEQVYEEIFIRLIPLIIEPKMQSEALNASIIHGFYEAVEKMLENNFTIDKQHLLSATDRNNVNMVKILMDYGVNPDLLSTKQKAYLHYEMQDVLAHYPRRTRIKERLEKQLEASTTNIVNNTTTNTTKHKI